MPRRKSESQKRPVLVQVENFDRDMELFQIKLLRAEQRKKVYVRRVSKLLPYRAELMALRERGANLGDLKVWLEQRVKIKITTASISRFLNKQ